MDASRGTPRSGGEELRESLCATRDPHCRRARRDDRPRCEIRSTWLKDPRRATSRGRSHPPRCTRRALTVPFDDRRRRDERPLLDAAEPPFATLHSLQQMLHLLAVNGRRFSGMGPAATRPTRSPRFEAMRPTQVVRTPSQQLLRPGKSTHQPVSPHERSRDRHAIAHSPSVRATTRALRIFEASRPSRWRYSTLLAAWPSLTVTVAVAPKAARDARRESRWEI